MSVGDRLAERLLDACALVCTTGDEGPICNAVEGRYRDRGEAVARVGNSVVVGPVGQPGRPLVLLVGHLDVVPPTDDDRTPRRETVDGEDRVIGRGASDMKGGNVVAMDLFEDPEVRDGSAYQLALVLYAGEEGPDDGNELRAVLGEVDWLHDAALAIVLEPTDLEVQAGCLGGLHALVRFRGRAAHSARPWHGRNALTAAGGFLAELDTLGPRDVDVDGITYRDVFSATQAWTDNARNVIPGEFVINLNYRFAPSRSLADAEAELVGLVGDRAEVEIIDRAAPAPPRLDAPVMQAFLSSTGAPVTAKQAWTDVARFAEVGVAGVNYGPGLTAQAHQAGEYVPVAALAEAHGTLRRFLLG